MSILLSPTGSVLFLTPFSVQGASAYIGASKFFENKVRLCSLHAQLLCIDYGAKEYLLAAATILSTESRHSGWVDSAIRKGSAWSGPFDVRSTFSDFVKSRVLTVLNCRPLLT